MNQPVMPNAAKTGAALPMAVEGAKREPLPTPITIAASNGRTMATMARLRAISGDISAGGGALSVPALLDGLSGGLLDVIGRIVAPRGRLSPGAEQTSYINVERG